MRKKKVDNFHQWRKEMKAKGKMISHYPKLTKDGNLAELIGVILGDGSIHKYKRTEGLRIVSNSNNPHFVKRYCEIINQVFNKYPSATKRKGSNAIDIRIYQKYLSKRLGIPCGSRFNLKSILPSWIGRNRKYTIRYLRGLYEAEGSYSVHLPTSTYKFIFSNSNPHLLNVVFILLKKLGFNPHKDLKKVQLSRKEETRRIIEFLEFRKY